MNVIDVIVARANTRLRVDDGDQPCPPTRAPQDTKSNVVQSAKLGDRNLVQQVTTAIIRVA